MTTATGTIRAAFQENLMPTDLVPVWCRLLNHQCDTAAGTCTCACHEPSRPGSASSPR